MEIEILLWFQKIREALGLPFSTLIAVLSDVLCYGAVVLAILLYWCKNKKLGVALMSIYGISLFINQFLKASFTVSRPWVKDTNITPTDYAIKGATGYSFPSNHVQTVTSINGTLAAQKKKNVLLINTFIIVFMAFTRMFIGVHTPKDVIFGIITGGISIILYYLYLKSIKDYPEREKEFLLLFFIISAICIIYVLAKSYPQATEANQIIVDPLTMKKDSMRSIAVFFTVFLGTLLEKKYVRFSTKVSNKYKWQRLIIGVIISLAVFGLSRLLLPMILRVELARLVETFLLVITVTFIYPFIFNKYERKWMEKFMALKNREVSIFPHE